MSVTSVPKQDMTCGRRMLAPFPITLPNRATREMEKGRVGGPPSPKAHQKPVPGKERISWPHFLLLLAAWMQTIALLCDSLVAGMATWWREQELTVLDESL